jgi:hypothetical protein
MKGQSCSEAGAHDHLPATWGARGDYCLTLGARWVASGATCPSGTAYTLSEGHALMSATVTRPVSICPSAHTRRAPSGSRSRTRDIRRRRGDASCSIRRSANVDSECPCGWGRTLRDITVAECPRAGLTTCESQLFLELAAAAVAPPRSIPLPAKEALLSPGGASPIQGCTAGSSLAHAASAPGPAACSTGGGQQAVPPLFRGLERDAERILAGD